MHLKHPLYLNPNVKIALMDISFPDSICSIPEWIANEPIIIKLFNEQNQVEEHQLKIPKNYFCDSNDLTMAMNRLLSEQLKEVLYFDNINRFLRITAKTKRNFIIGFPRSLFPILGMYDYPQGENSRTFDEKTTIFLL